MAQKDQLMHMKNRDDEAEKTAFEKFEQELKQTIFGILFLILKDEETTFWKVTSLMVVCELQILVLIFNEVINYPWKSFAFAVYFKGFFQLLIITYWCSLLNWVAYLIIFYVGVFLLVVVLANIIYAAYLFSHKQFTIMWPFHILRTACSLCITVFFYPFIDLFSSMFKCTNVNGVSSHYIFSDVACWKDMHILHATVGIISFVAYVVICLVVVMCFFETKISSSDPSARSNSRNEFWSMIFKTLCNLMNVFFIRDEYRWINTIVFIIGGIILYIKQRNERPYYNENVNIVSDINNGIFMWSSFMLVIVLIAENTSFDGGIQAYLMGVPLVILLLLTKGDPRKDTLLKPIEDFDSGELWYIKLRYYISFIQRKEMNRDVSVQLKGYIYNHEEKCKAPSCPLKAYIANITSIIKDKKKKQSKAAAENFVLLMRFANSLFLQGITKFPTCTSLRIAYAFFLKERMNNRTLAINELLSAEKAHPPFDEQFVIYRYRKMIEDEMADVQADNQVGTLDGISMIAYENYLRQFRESIERTALLHMEFWLEVLEPEPDLGKLDKTGSKIHTSIALVEDYWGKLQKVNANAPKALKMYADFLIEILNDAEAGGELMSRAKETAIVRTNFNANALDAAEMIGIGDMCAAMGGADGTPCMIASGEQEKLGEIIQFNMAVGRLLGYTKAELSNRKINTLMPDMYARHHDKILQRCINSTEDLSNSGDKGEIFVLARHKNGYIVPIFLQTRMVTSITQGTLFAATLKQEKKGLNACYMLLNEQQDVVALSSQCITALRLSNRSLRNYRVSFQTLVPNIQDKSMIVQLNASKAGTPVDFFYPDTVYEEVNDPQAAISPQRSDIAAETLPHIETPAKKLRVKASKDSIRLMCVMTEVNVMGEMSGYLVRLEREEENKDFAVSLKLEKIQKHPNFQFTFDPIEMKYSQEDCLEDAQKRIAEATSSYVNIMRDRSYSSISPVKSDESKDRIDTSMVSLPPGGDEISRIQQNLIKRKAFGENIKTRRIVDGDIVDIENANSRLIEKQLEEEPDSEEAKRRDKKEDKKEDIFQSSLKSKKAFNAALNEKSVPASINKLKKTGCVIALAILVLAATEFGLITTEFKDIGENINMVKYSYLRIAIQMKLVYHINKIVLFKRTTNPRLADTSSSIADSKTAIANSLNEYYDVQNKITLSKLSLSSENSRLYTDKNVSLYYKNASLTDSAYKSYTLTEAVQQLASEAFTIKSFASDSSYVVGNDDVDFVLFNSFSDLYDKMALSANLYVQELQDRGKNKQVIVYALFASALFVCIVSVVFLFPVVAGVSQTRLNVLSLFFDIPQSSVKSLEKKCEKFIARTNDENVDDVISEGDVLTGTNGVTIDASEAPESGRSRSKRKFKNNTTSNTTFYLQFLFAVLIIAGYFSLDFAYGYIFLKAISKYSRELNATAGIHAETAVSFGIFQNLIGNRRLLMYNEALTFNRLAIQEISTMYSIASEVQNSHNDNLNTFSDSYQNTFINIMRKSLCDMLTPLNFTFPYNVTSRMSCSGFRDGTIIEGLHPLIIHYIEELRERLTTYRSIAFVGTNQATINATITKTFLTGPEMFYTETAVFGVIDSAMRYLIDKLIGSYQSQYDKEITMRIILFICFMLLFIISFLSLWTPFVNKLNDEIWRTKTMLTLIPYEVCKNIPSIKKFLSQQSLFSNKLQS